MENDAQLIDLEGGTTRENSKPIPAPRRPTQRLPNDPQHVSPNHVTIDQIPAFSTPQSVEHPDEADEVKIGLAAINATLTIFATRLNNLEDRIQRSLAETETELQNNMFRRLINLEARIQRSFEDNSAELQQDIQREINQRVEAGVQQIAAKFERKFQVEIAKAEARLNASFGQRLEELAELPTPVTAHAGPRRIIDEAVSPCTAVQQPPDEKRVLGPSEASAQIAGPAISTAGWTTQRAGDNHQNDRLPSPPTSLDDCLELSGDSSRTFLKDPASHTYLLQDLRGQVKHHPLTLSAERRVSPAKTSSTAQAPLLEYDGIIPWAQYTTHLRLVAKANGWDDDTCRSMFTARLRGSALEYFSELPTSCTQDLGSLFKRFATRFERNKEEAVWRGEFRNRFQRPGESLQDYAVQLERLTHHAHPGWPSNIVEKITLEQFLFGIRDPELQLAVRNHKPTNIAEAIQQGMEFKLNRELVRSGPGATRVTARPAGIQPPTEEVGKIEEQKSGNDQRSQ